MACLEESIRYASELSKGRRHKVVGDGGHCLDGEAQELNPGHQYASLLWLEQELTEAYSQGQCGDSAERVRLRIMLGVVLMGQDF